MQPVIPPDTTHGTKGSQAEQPPTKRASDRPSGSFLWVASYGLALTILLCLTAQRHGPWFDEFWTRFFSDPSVSLSSAFHDRWAQDVHPPLFSFLVWLSAHIDRLPIEQARLLNLIPLTSLIIYAGLVCRRLPRERSFIAILMVALGASSFLVDAFVEFRSYLTGLCAFTSLLVTLVAQDRLRPEEDGDASTLLWCGYAISLFVCLNIHYLTTAMTVVLVAVFGVAAAIKGDRRRFAIYLTSGIVAAIPFVAFILYQWGTIARIWSNYWLKTDLEQASDMLAAAIVAPTAGPRSLVAVAWILAVALLLRARPKPRLGGTALVVFAALLAEVAMLLIYTTLTAALTDRYLAPLAILSIAVFSIVLSRPIWESRWLLPLFVVSSLYGAVASALPHRDDPRWDEAAHYLAMKQKACPAARIIPMQQDLNDHTPNTVENYNEAYAYMAQKWGLTLGEVDTPSSRPASVDCGDYYWADHFFAAGKSRDTLLAQFLERWPALRGCTIIVRQFESQSAVFEVQDPGPACRR
ncbi:MAG TPA: hypothetical protein VN112_12250 [Ensifer sp.]|nr:hypothetical protein [Ensifer sp.]